MGTGYENNQGLLYGPGLMATRVIAYGTGTIAMNVAGDIIAIPFVARSTDDVASVRVYFTAATRPGSETVSCEIQKTSGGLPDGAEYDANAVKAGVVPTGSAVCDFTFDTLPTTGLVVGDLYWVVLQASAAWTSLSLASAGVGVLTFKYQPSTWTKQTSTPACQVLFESSARHDVALNPYYIQVGNTTTYGTTKVYGAKFTAYTPMTVSGIVQMGPTAIGSPTCIYRFRILDSGLSQVAGAVAYISGGVLGSSNIITATPFTSGDITLAPGTYYACADDYLGTGDASNYIRFYGATPLSTSGINTNFLETLSTDSGASFVDSTVGRIGGLGLYLGSMSGGILLNGPGDAYGWE